MTYLYPWTRANSFIREVENELTRGLDSMRHWPLNTAQSPFKFNASTADNALVIEGVVPGLSKKDITIEIVDSVLCIDSKKEDTKIDRKFTLPEDSDIDNISAVCKDGLLTVTIPQIVPETISRKITIK